jgi:hypothetical protein
VFFKPLFTCAASSKALTIGHQLEVIAAVSVFLPDFWTRDTEMILVALMNGPTAILQSGSKRKWEQARLGQAIILVELIARVKAVPRISQDFSVSQS